MKLIRERKGVCYIQENGIAFHVFLCHQH
jgi:hypothetical protein